MSVLATYTKIQSIAAASSGIVSAPTQIPTQLNDDILPCVLTVPGPAQWNEHAVGLYRQERTYYVRCYVQPVAQGIGVDEGFQAVLPILNALGGALVRNPTLDSTIDGIGTAGRQVFTDAGVQVLEYAGVQYHGFQLELQVIEKST